MKIHDLRVVKVSLIGRIKLHPHCSELINIALIAKMKLAICRDIPFLELGETKHVFIKHKHIWQFGGAFCPDYNHPVFYALYFPKETCFPSNVPSNFPSNFPSNGQ